MKTQREGGHLQSGKNVPLETEPCSNLGLELSTLQNRGKINLCCGSHPVCGILLEQPELTQARETFACNLKNMASVNLYLSDLLNFHLCYTVLLQKWDPF